MSLFSSVLGMSSGRELDGYVKFSWVSSLYVKGMISTFKIPGEVKDLVQKEYSVRVTDGTILSALHVCTRENLGTKQPTILIRSPYGKDIILIGTAILASMGYHLIVQDCRQDFRDDAVKQYPLSKEGEDGIDTIRWIEQQCFFDGNIGMFGPSYLGQCQYAVVDLLKSEGITSVKAFLPINASASIISAIYPCGVLNLELLARWNYLVFHVHSPGKGGFEKIWNAFSTQSVMKKVYNRLPLVEIDSIVVGREVPWIRDVISYPDEHDPFWKQSHAKLRLCEISNCPPVHFFIGWYDIFLLGALHDYKDAMVAEIDCKLTIGPWGHWDIMQQYRESFPAAAEWFGKYLRGIEPEVKPRVRIYVLGLDVWMGMSHFPPIEAKKHAMMIHANGSISTDDKEEDFGTLQYEYDPRDPTPVIGGPSFDFHNYGPKNCSKMETREDILVFTSDILDSDVNIIGSVSLEMYVWSSNPRADFVFRICNVTPKGESLVLCDTIGTLKPDLLKLEDVSVGGSFQKINLSFMRLTIPGIANVFKKGHQIRVHITSGAHPRWVRNPGCAKPHHLATEADLQTSQQLIAFGKYMDHLLSPRISFDSIEDISKLPLL